MRLANPKPGFCSCCFAASPELRFIDCEADYDGAPVLDPETQTIAVLPWTGDLGGHDQLMLCETCVKKAAELVEFKPELHQRQLREIRKLELQVATERAARKRAEADRDEWKGAYEQSAPTHEPHRRPRRAA